MDIYILHLYFDLLDIYGEHGNVVIMKRHLEDQGFSVHIERKTIGDEINFLKYQFIYMGCGTENNFFKSLEDIKRFKNQISYAIENEKVFLTTGNSFEMFGDRIGKEEGLKIFDFESIRSKTIKSSDIIYSFAKKRVI